MIWSESLAEKVSDVAKDNEDEVADVGSEEVVVRWLVDNRLVELSSHVLTDISMALAPKRPKLRIHSCLSLCLCN